MAEEKPSWVKMKPAELESLIVEMGKNGESPARIGLTLRDKHGIPKAKLVSKRISTILKEKKIDFKDEASKTEERIAQIQKHIAKNKHDNTARKSLEKKLWTVRRLKSNRTN